MGMRDKEFKGKSVRYTSRWIEEQSMTVVSVARGICGLRESASSCMGRVAMAMEAVSDELAVPLLVLVLLDLRVVVATTTTTIEKRSSSRETTQFKVAQGGKLGRMAGEGEIMKGRQGESKTSPHNLTWRRKIMTTS